MEITVTISKGKIESDYIGVTEQAGIYAGDGAFAVNVDDTARLNPYPYFKAIMWRKS